MKGRRRPGARRGDEAAGATPLPRPAAGPPAGDETGRPTGPGRSSSLWRAGAAAALALWLATAAGADAQTAGGAPPLPPGQDRLADEASAPPVGPGPTQAATSGPPAQPAAATDPRRYYLKLDEAGWGAALDEAAEGLLARYRLWQYAPFHSEDLPEWCLDLFDRVDRRVGEFAEAQPQTGEAELNQWERLWLREELNEKISGLAVDGDDYYVTLAAAGPDRGEGGEWTELPTARPEDQPPAPEAAAAAPPAAGPDEQARYDLMMRAWRR
ncbi:MAG: hypothetical protein LBS31_10475 [Candidatus Adiutrix sp.]|jgi:hypothetical protein|nr:hypothetical protein [Candidatus Adiutrix sp.]